MKLIQLRRRGNCKCQVATSNSDASLLMWKLTTKRLSGFVECDDKNEGRSIDVGTWGTSALKSSELIMGECT